MSDTKLLKFVKSFRHGLGVRGDGRFECFAICAPLVTLLNMEGWQGQLKTGNVKFDLGECNHYWIELEDGRVLDPTAAQFNERLGLDLPRVYLGPPTKIHVTQQIRTET
jgi:hypothetical protein